jgi:hypothetical protein
MNKDDFSKRILNLDAEAYVSFPPQAVLSPSIERPVLEDLLDWL